MRTVKITTMKGLFCCRRNPLRIPPKRNHNQPQSHPRKAGFQTINVTFCSCDTCKRDLKSKEKQKLVEQQLDERPLRESMAVAESGDGTRAPSGPQFSSCPCPELGRSCLSNLSSFSTQVMLGHYFSILAKLHLGQFHSAYLEVPLMLQWDTILLFTACPNSCVMLLCVV